MILKYIWATDLDDSLDVVENSNENRFGEYIKKKVK